MRLLIFIFTACWLLSSTPSFAASNDNCECEVLSCNPCQRESNIEFYTSKCAGTRVKSCQRPVCVDLDDPPADCRKNNLAAAPSVKEAAPVKVTKTVEKMTVGTVLMSIGDVQVKRDGVSNPIKVSHKVFNDDEIAAGDNGKIKIIFTDDSSLTLLPRSRTKVNHTPAGKDKGSNSNTVVNLLFGTVRSVVTKSENGQRKYRVETPSAVAGVRGTDFLTSYYEASQITKVQTLDGNVELASISGGTKTMVPAGRYASFVVDTDNNDHTSSSMKYVDNGFITPLGTINEENKKDIDKKFDFDTTREIAANAADSKPICGTPTGFFNQCSFTCVNNPKKSDHCKTELPNVKCLRKRCNANGTWAEESRLPAAEYEKCPANGITVDKCDY
jgi:hypothetical protein